jgi:cytochrome c oxidase subunit 2
VIGLLGGWAAEPTSPLEDVLAAVNAFMRWALHLPIQGTAIARRIDELQYAEFAFFWVIGAVVLGAAAWFAVRYHRRPGGERAPTPEVHAPLWLEGVVVAVLLGAFVLFWVVGFRQYVEATQSPPGALEVYVTAKQWMWKFSYPSGAASAGVLYVPVGRPVRLVMTSRDVIHSFFVPAFRMKRDVLPGRYTSTWFQAEHIGRYQILCAEFCGAGHSRMWGEVVVLPPDEYSTWLADQVPVRPGPRTEGASNLILAEPVPRKTLNSLADYGLKVAALHGCMRCHTVDGTPHIGPTWLGLYGSEVPLDDGRTVTADAAYLTESMMDPMAQIVRGFKPVMPTYQGLLQPAEVAAMLEYMKTLATPADEARAVPEPTPAAPLPPEVGGHYEKRR